jgi:hypothetical protein
MNISSSRSSTWLFSSLSNVTQAVDLNTMRDGDRDQLGAGSVGYAGGLDTAAAAALLLVAVTAGLFDQLVRARGRFDGGPDIQHASYDDERRGP